MEGVAQTAPEEATMTTTNITTPARMIFVNLPVADLARSTAFYEALGATKNEQFCDATASCMVFSDTIHAMLLTHDKFRQFTPKAIADARTTTEVLNCSRTT